MSIEPPAPLSLCERPGSAGMDCALRVSRMSLTEWLLVEGERGGSGVAWIEAVADPRLCQDIARIGRIGFDLFSQLADKDA